MGGAKRYPSIAFRGGDGYRGAPILQIDDKIVICPSGCLLTGLSSCFSDFAKNVSVPTHPKSDLELSHPTPQEGRIMIVTDAGWNAVDAAALARDGIAGRVDEACERSPGEQTNGTDADGKIVWS